MDNRTTAPTNISKNRSQSSLLGMLFTACVIAALPASAQPITLQVPITAPWFDTGIDLVAGQRLTIVSSNWVIFGSEREYIGNADGISPFTDGKSVAGPGHVLPDSIPLSLIGKIGGTKTVGTGTAIPQAPSGRAVGMVGTSYTAIMTSSGRLYLGYNDQLSAFLDNSRTFTVTITIDEATSVPSVAICSAIQLSWPSLVDRLYVVQSSLDLQTWEDFVGVIRGTGAELSVYDSTRDRPKRFYRVFLIGSDTQ